MENVDNTVDRGPAQGAQTKTGEKHNKGNMDFIPQSINQQVSQAQPA